MVKQKGMNDYSTLLSLTTGDQVGRQLLFDCAMEFASANRNNMEFGQSLVGIAAYGLLQESMGDVSKLDKDQRTQAVHAVLNHLLDKISN